MRQVKQTLRWGIGGLLLFLAVPTFTQTLRAETGPQKQPRAMVQLLSQTNTIAVCGEEDCHCGASTLVSKEFAPCTVTSMTGGCTTGSGACCVCTASRTIAVCGEEDCDCGATGPLTRVNAPCTVTSTAGSCTSGVGACCVCAAK